jgi:signal transduction histidine kinase
VKLRGIPLVVRVALLLLVAVVVGHLLAMTLMFELRPRFPAFGPPGPPGPPGTPPASPPPMTLWMQLGMLLDLGVRLAALGLAAWIAVRWLLAPMKRLACAARALGEDIQGPPLPEDGTRECREVSRLFNQMQSRIRLQWSARDRFVAAVSHDLRTPLARLRLRAESLADSEQKRQFSRDITEMDDMIRTTLDYLCGAADAEATVRLDLAALVRSLAEDLREAGHRVTVQGTAEPLPAQALAMRRCIGNLVENAIRYGGAAHVRLIDSPEAVEIAVHDPGPGLPDAELHKVMAPFYRVEATRSANQSGVGLGLSIAQDIARRHGGELTLSNKRGVGGSGLVATLRFPRNRQSLPAPRAD